MRISDWSSDVCSSDLPDSTFSEDADSVGELYFREWPGILKVTNYAMAQEQSRTFSCADGDHEVSVTVDSAKIQVNLTRDNVKGARLVVIDGQHRLFALNTLMTHDRSLIEGLTRSEEHTSELQSLMRISYAVFCWKKKTTKIKIIEYRQDMQD